jgi:hypothetical protein
MIQQLFLALLLAAVAALAADEPATTASRAGALRPARVITPNEFKGTDVERINRAIEAAVAAGGHVLIPRINQADGGRKTVWLLDSAILLRSHTTLALDNCHLKLSDRCRDNFMRSANCGIGITNLQPLHAIHIRGIGGAVLEGADHPRATGDSGKTLAVGAQIRPQGRWIPKTYGTDAGVAGESQTGDWRNIGILLASVEDFSIEHLAIHDSHAWAISLERCARGKLGDLAFASRQRRMIDGAEQLILNQDGLDLRRGCHDITIENITGFTGDDLVALTAIPPRKGKVAGSLGSTEVSGSVESAPGADDIRNITLKNICGYCAGGHHIVRFLNTPGVGLHDVLLDGLVDTSPAGLQCRAAVKIGDRAYGGGVAPLGTTHHITISNVVSKAQSAILIGGSLCDSVLDHITHAGPTNEAVTFASGPENVRDVKITNLKSSKP